MGGGNEQKLKTAQERKAEKMKGSKGSQLDANKKAMSIQVLFSEPVVISSSEFLEQNASSICPALKLIGDGILTQTHRKKRRIQFLCGANGVGDRKKTVRGRVRRREGHNVLRVDSSREQRERGKDSRSESGFRVDRRRYDQGLEDDTLCTTKLPNLRPSKKEVVKMLADAEHISLRSADIFEKPMTGLEI